MNRRRPSERSCHVPRWSSACWLVCALAAGCGQSEESAPAARSEVQVRVVSPERRTIDRSVGQPAFIDAYEQTAIFPKIAGYVSHWAVDIGDRIKKDQVIAELFVPELDAEYEEKKADLARDKVLIQVAERMVAVAKSQLDVAVADVAKARADIGKYQSAVERWESEVGRLTKLVADRVVDRQILDESQKQLKSNLAERDAAQAAYQSAQSLAAARQADLERAGVDVDAARAKTLVAQAVVDRFAALRSYTRLTSPYDGVVVVRNVNTGDFVQPAAGDKTSDLRQNRGAGGASPMYVVARTDIVRVFVDVPEMEANHVAAGTEARVQIQALDGEEIHSVVTRTSWSLNVQSRTLRAEVDLKNPDAKLLPGMYAYADVLIHRQNVMAVPLAAIVQRGNQKCCYMLHGGKAIEVPVQTGTDDGQWIEIAKMKSDDKWVNVRENEQVILGNLAELVSGEAVQVAPQTGQGNGTTEHEPSESKK